jgi:hypothetical protein
MASHRSTLEPRIDAYDRRSIEDPFHTRPIQLRDVARQFGSLFLKNIRLLRRPEAGVNIALKSSDLGRS